MWGGGSGNARDGGVEMLGAQMDSWRRGQSIGAFRIPIAFVLNVSTLPSYRVVGGVFATAKLRVGRYAHVITETRVILKLGRNNYCGGLGDYIGGWIYLCPHFVSNALFGISLMSVLTCFGDSYLRVCSHHVYQDELRIGGCVWG